MPPGDGQAAVAAAPRGLCTLSGGLAGQKPASRSGLLLLGFCVCAQTCLVLGWRAQCQARFPCWRPSWRPWATALSYRCRRRSSCFPGPVLCARLLTWNHRARAPDQRQLVRAPRSPQPFPGGSRGSAGPPAGPLSFPEPRSFGRPGSGLRGSTGPGPPALVQPRLPLLLRLGGTGHLPAAGKPTAHGEQEGGGRDTAGKV